MIISDSETAARWCRYAAGKHRNPLKRWAFRFVAKQLERASADAGKCDGVTWIEISNLQSIQRLHSVGECAYRALGSDDTIHHKRGVDALIESRLKRARRNKLPGIWLNHYAR